MSIKHTLSSGKAKAREVDNFRQGGADINSDLQVAIAH